MTSQNSAGWIFLIAVAVIVSLWGWGEISEYGESRYQQGRADAIAEQKRADDAESQRREEEKKAYEQDAQKRISQANADAATAAGSAGRLQQQIATIRKQLSDHSDAIGISNPTGTTSDMLAIVLSKSVERNVELARYADAARESGLTCQNQYNSLRNKKAP